MYIKKIICKNEKYEFLTFKLNHKTKSQRPICKLIIQIMNEELKKIFKKYRSLCIWKSLHMVFNNCKLL